MTTEEKAKAYDEALKQAKKFHTPDSNNSNLKAVLELIFPELAESEDERIRKSLIKDFRNYYEMYDKSCGEPKWGSDSLVVKDILDWLERRKEQKPVEQIEDDEEKSIGTTLIDALKGNARLEWELKRAGVDAKKLIAYLEQKPTEWSEDYQEEDIQTRFAFYTYKDDPSVLYLSNVFVEETSRNHGFGTRILKAAEKAAEAIGAITIVLKVKQDSPANAWYRRHGYGYVAFEDGYDWLEKNLEYLKPVKQEWSEEDRLHYANVLEALEYVKGCKSDYDKIEAVKSDIAWLKLLRNRVGKEFLQPHWKPSDEQLRPLEYAIDYFKKKKNDTTYLESLYEELKKL